MTDIKLYTRLSAVMTATAAVLTGLSLYAGAFALVLPGIAFVLGVWSAFFLLSGKPSGRAWPMTLTLLFLGYAAWLVWLTGGFYSPGILLLVAVPATTGPGRDNTVFLTSAALAVAALCFFYLGPVRGPGLLNLNEYRALFVLTAAAGIGAMIYFGIASSISDRDRLDARVRAADEKIEQVSRDARNAIAVKDRFLANMSHEIRNPMNGIIGMMHILLDSDLDAEQRRNADIVYSSARALLSIVNDVLDLSKIEADKFELDIRPFDLEIAVRDIVSLPGVQARQKGLDFTYAVDADVPKLLKGDIGRLRQVILNLTGNAIKFTETGAVSLTVSLTEDSPERAVLNFRVDDTGIGIREEALEGLFSAFVQADASITKQYGGTGLGLSISKLMVEKMGGRISAESVEMIGSTFWFDIPLEKQSPAEAAIDLETVPVEARRVLWVSDADTPGKQMADALARSGLNYERAADEPAAFVKLETAAAKGDPFHILVAEVRESDLFARTLGQRMNDTASLSGVKRILVTAVGQKGDAKAFEELGFSAYLSFPLENGVFDDCVRAVSALSSSGHPIITRFTLAETRKQCCRILVVEDMETNLITARALIGKQGYQTDEARNGEQALEKVSRETYDLVLMDCQMPVMDGYEATRRIREREADQGLKPVPIVAMTGNAFERDREACFKAGMDDFISKPVEPDVLARIIQQYVTKQALDDSGEKEGEAERPGHDLPDLDAFLDLGESSLDDLLDVPAGDWGKTEELPPGGSSPADSLPVFDRGRCLERFGGDPELVEVVLASFFEESAELMGNLVTAVRDGNPEAVKTCAHALKGSTANVNAEQLSHTAHTLEQRAGQGDIGQAEELLSAIEDQLKAFTGEATL